MSKIYADLVWETSLSTGTGALTLEGAEDGYRTFAEGVGDGNTCSYTINDGINWEAGIGTVVVSGGTTILQRTTVKKSSNSNAAVNFTAGEKQVYQAFIADEIDDVVTHLDDTSNPHSVTPSQIGAATAADLTAHEDDTSNPHGVDTTQIGAATAADLTAHEDDTANPHGVTYTQAGAAPASHVTDETNPHNVTYDQTDAAPITHVSDTDNPHAVDKTDVGLGNVQDVDQTNADNLTSGTVADARLPVSQGHKEFTTEPTEIMTAYTTYNEVLHIQNPQDGAFTNSGAYMTGALKVRLPVLYTGPYVAINLKIYVINDFTASPSADSFLDVYLAGELTSSVLRWRNVSAYISGNTDKTTNYTIRFGNDGTRACIYIFEDTDGNRLLNAIVTDVYVYDSDVTGLYSTWSENWAILDVTSFDTVDETITTTSVKNTDAQIISVIETEAVADASTADSLVQRTSDGDLVATQFRNEITPAPAAPTYINYFMAQQELGTVAGGADNQLFPVAPTDVMDTLKKHASQIDYVRLLQASVSDLYFKTLGHPSSGYYGIPQGVVDTFGNANTVDETYFAYSETLNLFKSNSNVYDISVCYLGDLVGDTLLRILESDIGSGNDDLLYSIWFNPDGSAFYLMLKGGDAFYQYDLGTNWQIHTATYTGKSSIVGLTTPDGSFMIKDDGTKLNYFNATTQVISKFTMSTPWDITTLSEDGETVDVSTVLSGTDYAPNKMFINQIGNKVIFTDPAEHAVLYMEMSPNWDLSTLSFNSSDYRILDDDKGSLYGAFINADGDEMIVAGENGSYSAFYHYNLTTPWDITSAEYSGNYLDFVNYAADATERSFYMNPDGNRVFPVGLGYHYIIDFFIPVHNNSNCTLTWNSDETATVIPEECFVTIDVKYLESVTVASDLKIEVTRDGGTTWTEGTLHETATIDTDRQLLTSYVDLSGQPSGNAMNFRVSCFNYKHVEVYNIALQWTE
jgi:hypothetical protein